MIRKLSHAPFFVLDQDRAKALYTEKLGFEVRTDARMGSFRWLTVSPPSQPDVEIILMPIATSPMLDEASAEQLRALVAGGKMGAGAYHTDDCAATYAELSARGVVFKSPPQQRPYGIEAVFCDDSGNWFSLTQPA